MTTSIRQQQERRTTLSQIEQETPSGISPHSAPVHADVREIQSLRGRLAAKEHQTEFDKEIVAKEFERTAPLREAERQFRETANAVARAEQEWVRQDLMNTPDNPELAKRCKAYVPAENQTAEEVYTAVGNAHKGAILAIEAKGYQVQQPAFDKKLKHILSQNLALDTRLQATFDSLIEYGIEIGLWSDRELVAPAPQPVAVETLVTERTVEMIQAELDAISDTRNPTDRRRVQELRAELLVLEARSGIWADFCQFIRANYDSFGVEEQKRCTTWLGKNNLLMNVVNLNRYRVARGWRTPDEELGSTIENSDRSVSDYDVKQDIKSRQRQLAQAPAQTS